MHDKRIRNVKSAINLDKYESDFQKSLEYKKLRKITSTNLKSLLINELNKRNLIEKKNIKTISEDKIQKIDLINTNININNKLRKRTKSNMEKLNKEIMIKENRLKTSKDKMSYNLTSQFFTKNSNTTLKNETKNYCTDYVKNEDLSKKYSSKINCSTNYNNENDNKVFNIRSNNDLKESIIKPKSGISQSNYSILNSNRVIKTSSSHRIKTYISNRKLNNKSSLENSPQLIKLTMSNMKDKIFLKDIISTNEYEIYKENNKYGPIKEESKYLKNDDEKISKKLNESYSKDDKLIMKKKVNYIDNDETLVLYNDKAFLEILNLVEITIYIKNNM
jgi:hypothetical protein